MKSVLTSSIVVFLAIFLSHVFLLTKALQCSYDEEIFLVLRSELNLTEIGASSSAAEKGMNSRLSDCKFATFLEEKFVFVDFLFDCVAIAGSDGSMQFTGAACGNSSYFDRKPTLIFSDNKTVFLELLKPENGIFYSKDGLYNCS